jgi:hypothetical protein
MEINYVLLGIVSSVIVFLLGYAVVVIFNFKNRIDYLESFLEDTDEKDIIALLDSRLDKLEYKFRADVTSGTEVLKVIEASKKSNERLDEFIRTFQAQ